MKPQIQADCKLEVGVDPIILRLITITKDINGVDANAYTHMMAM